MILVIDDVKTFPFSDNKKVVYARTLKDAYKEMQEGLEELWLDHDLGTVNGVEEDIRPFCLMLAEAAYNGKPWSIGKIVICSLNPVGVDWIASTLNKYYKVERCTMPGEAIELLGSDEVGWY